jgi:DNA-directed RNA polymerase specialized sigma24 family protein
MTSNFKKLSQESRSIEPRAAIPQVDPEAPKPMPAEPVAPAPPTPVASTVEPTHQAPTAAPSGERQIYLTPVNSDERGVSQAFNMLPSRHAQLLDMAYIEGLKPWQIIEDALEDRVIKRYGKEYRRK